MMLNNGFSVEEVLQNRFTALIVISLTRARISYFEKKTQYSKYICETEDDKFAFITDDTDFVSLLCDSDVLSNGLKQIDNRERYVILSRVVEGKRFEDIADKLGLKYKGVAAIYYRGIAKLKKYVEVK